MRLSQPAKVSARRGHSDQPRSENGKRRRRSSGNFSTTPQAASCPRRPKCPEVRRHNLGCVHHPRGGPPPRSTRHGIGRRLSANPPTGCRRSTRYSGRRRGDPEGGLHQRHMIIDLGPELLLVVEERQRMVTRLGHEFARPGFRQLRHRSIKSGVQRENCSRAVPVIANEIRKRPSCRRTKSSKSRVAGR